MFCINREMLIMYLNGVLLDRNGVSVKAVNEIECKIAISQLNLGNKIFLTDNGFIVSSMSKCKNGYVESRVNNETTDY